MYCEVQSRSHFSFLESIASPKRLVERAVEIGLAGLCVADRAGFYGVVPLQRAARRANLPLRIGTIVQLAEGGLTVLARNRRGYGELGRAITSAQARSPKGSAESTWHDLDHVQDAVAVVGGEGSLLDTPDPRLARQSVAAVAERWPTWLTTQRTGTVDAHRREQRARWLAKELDLPLIASTDALMVTPQQRAALDVLWCIRNKTTLRQAGRALLVNRNRHLAGPDTLRSRFADSPELVERTQDVLAATTNPLDELVYHLPRADRPASFSNDDDWLRHLCEEGLRQRFDNPHDSTVRGQLERELDIVAKLDLAGYFLIVWDIVAFCQHKGILCQGRGSAANSLVCYALGITPIDPLANKLLFERFLSEARSEPPDIDLDIAHNDRERVIQYVYERYGRDHVAMVCNIVTFRRRLAIRETAKVLGASPQLIDELVATAGRFEDSEALEGLCSTSGLKHLPNLSKQLIGTPRHLGIHCGGMVLSRQPLAELVPIEPATMPKRTVIQWDKDACAEIGVVKIDLLGLGILHVIQEAFAWIGAQTGQTPSLGSLGSFDDPNVYDLICRCDTIGVFQVESRAQMNVLPATQPRTFYDLAVQVGLIRPGPIQGDMVHPYIRRRRGLEPISYPHPSLEPVLERTCGVPLFQEQVMRIAMEVGGFSGAQADALRRAMDAKASRERMNELVVQLLEGMRRAGVTRASADLILRQLTAFAAYGFPESHAMAFAFLVYASAWLKVYHPAPFFAALLNAQPMGFYSPDTLVRDAVRCGVEVLPISARFSAYDNQIDSQGRLRLGIRLVVGIGGETGKTLEAARRATNQGFLSIIDFCRRSGLTQRTITNLARVGAFADFGWRRRDAIWQVEALFNNATPHQPRSQLAGRPAQPRTPSLLAPTVTEQGRLRAMTTPESVVADYRGAGLTLASPLDALGEQLADIDYTRASDVANESHNSDVVVFGLNICAQSPPTANGVVFVLLEDESGLINVVVFPNIRRQYAAMLTRSPFLAVEGRVEKQRGGINVVATSIKGFHSTQQTETSATLNPPCGSGAQEPRAP